MLLYIQIRTTLLYCLFPRHHVTAVSTAVSAHRQSLGQLAAFIAIPSIERGTRVCVAIAFP
jgi:hypothetical protein